MVAPNEYRRGAEEELGGANNEGVEDEAPKVGEEEGLAGAKVKSVHCENKDGCGGEEEALGGANEGEEAGEDSEEDGSSSDGGVVTVTSSRHRAPQTGQMLPEKQRRWNVWAHSDVTVVWPRPTT
jgi:hypothetical protein